MIPNKKEEPPNNRTSYIRELLDSNYQGIKRLFVLPYVDTNANTGVKVDYSQKYFLPSVNLENYNIEIDGRNFYDQAINYPIKKYHEVRKTTTGKGDDYTTGCLLHYPYFDKSCKLIAADLSKQKALDADPKAIQQIVFTGEVKTKSGIYYILEQSKETVFELYKGTAKVL